MNKPKCIATAYYADRRECQLSLEPAVSRSYAAGSMIPKIYQNMGFGKLNHFRYPIFHHCFVYHTFSFSNFHTCLTFFTTPGNHNNSSQYLCICTSRLSQIEFKISFDTTKQNQLIAENKKRKIVWLSFESFPLHLLHLKLYRVVMLITRTPGHAWGKYTMTTAIQTRQPTVRHMILDWLSSIHPRHLHGSKTIIYRQAVRV